MATVTMDTVDSVNYVAVQLLCESPAEFYCIALPASPIDFNVQH